MTPKQQAKLTASTILVTGIDTELIHCTARQSFVVGTVRVEAGEAFFLVRSSKSPERYYVVAFARDAWTCSCGAGNRPHAHTQRVKSWIVEHVVKPRLSEMSTPKPAVPTVSPPTPASIQDIVRRVPLPRAADVVAKQITSSTRSVDVSSRGVLKTTGYTYLERGIPMR